MKVFISTLFLVFFTAMTFAQRAYHVFPINDKITPGKPSGKGSLSQPWDLQTALNNSKIIKEGDVIWLHEGIYDGRFQSKLSTNDSRKRITISAYKNEKVILNGNVKSNKESVLDVIGNGITFKNFEITFLGNFKRIQGESGFQKVSGINHRQGNRCQFINLKVYNNPGSGIGSWKRTADSEIKNCLIYNNGYIGKRGHGVGIYVQNESNKTRVIKGNVIFNNYYKGIEVWSASSGQKKEFVKHVNITNNIIFNNGSPAKKAKDNLIVATGDREGVNIAKHILIKGNVLYHNVDIKNGQINGDAATLTIGYKASAPVEHVRVIDNVIIGRNNALRLLHVKDLEFKNNRVYSGYVNLNKSILNKENTLDFNNNRYYTKKNIPFRVAKLRDYQLKDWQKTLKTDVNSKHEKIRAFKVETELKRIKNSENKNQFDVAVFDRNGLEAVVDFSEYKNLKRKPYVIYDIEYIDKVLVKGNLSEDGKIKIPMTSRAYSKPLHNSFAVKSNANFGVYRILFNEGEFIKKKKKKRTLWSWLFG